MFKYQLEDHRRTIMRMLLRTHPPQTVMLLKEQAEYLKLRPVNSYKGVPPERRAPVDTHAVKMSLVKVRVQEMFLALKSAKGIDEQDDEHTPDQVEGERISGPSDDGGLPPSEGTGV